MAEFDEVTLFHGPLGELGLLNDLQQGRDGTPNNVWPEDRSCLVYTDCDLMATKVNGPAELIARLDAGSPGRLEGGRTGATRLRPPSADAAYRLGLVR
jgi:hypothetical protein